MSSFTNAVNAEDQGVQYISTTGVWSGLDGGTAGHVLTSNGTGVAPSFQAAAGGGASLSPYIVGPTNSDYTTVQAAVDAAIIAGASNSTPANIYIKPGVYNETINVSTGGFNLIGLDDTDYSIAYYPPTPSDVVPFVYQPAVTITAIYGENASCKCQNIYFPQGATIFNPISGYMSFVNCVLGTASTYPGLIGWTYVSGRFARFYCSSCRIYDITSMNDTGTSITQVNMNNCCMGSSSIGGSTSTNNIEVIATNTYFDTVLFSCRVQNSVTASTNAILYGCTLNACTASTVVVSGSATTNITLFNCTLQGGLSSLAGTGVTVSAFCSNDGTKWITSGPTTTSASAGANGAVPAQVAGYLTINIAGTDYKIPYFNT